MVTVTFVVDRVVTSDRWLTVEVVAASRRHDCEHEESGAVTYAPVGSRVVVRLHPIDKFRWCSGVYHGNIHVERRIGCGEPGFDIGPCSTNGPTVARFTLRVGA
jgi:hypothetical protein